MTAHPGFTPIPTGPSASGKSPALGRSLPLHPENLRHRPLGGGIIALALAAALDIAATMAMTATTAWHVSWPDVAFRCLAAALIAVLLFAHARNFSAIKAAFTFGVVCGIAPSLLIAAHHEIDHWDDFMTWLGNALYIWKFGSFPTVAAPPVASIWPGYPPGSSIVLAAVWSAAGRVIETAGPLINVACLALLPGLALRAVGKQPRDAIGHMVVGAILGIAATMLNVGLDWHWVLSSLPETATLVAFTAAFVLAAEMQLLSARSPRSHLVALAAILALIANLKQTGIVLVALLALATLLLTWTWARGDRHWFRPAWTLALVCVPSLAVWLCWQFYRVNIFPADAFAFRGLSEWNFAALPDFLLAVERSVKGHWLFFVPISAVVLRGWYVLGRRWLAGDRAMVAPADRLAALFALVESGYLAFLFVCYLGAFTEKEARGAVEFFRYQSALGAAGLIVALALIMERLPQRLPAAAAPAILAAQVAIAAAILPAAGVYPGKAIYGPAEIQQVRQIGRSAGDAIARTGERVTVELAHNDGYLAVLIVRYEIWARAPLLVRGISGNWAGDDLPARFAAARPYAPYALALENQNGVHCAILGSGKKLDLIGPPAELPMCRPLLSRLQRMDERSTVGASSD